MYSDISRLPLRNFFWGSNLKYKFFSLRVVDKIVCCFTGFTAVILIPRRKLGKKGGTRSWTFLLIHCPHWKNGTLVDWNKKSVIFIIQFATSQKNKGHRSELFFHCLVWIRFLTCKQTNLKRKEKKCDSEELKLLEQSGKEEQKKKKTIKNFSWGGVESRLLRGNSLEESTICKSVAVGRTSASEDASSSTTVQAFTANWWDFHYLQTWRVCFLGWHWQRTRRKNGGSFFVR